MSMLKKLFQSNATHIALIFIPLLLASPLIYFGVGLAHDTGYQLGWIQSFWDEIHNGNLLPKWLYSANGGLGSPAFYFYPPFICYFLTTIDFLTFQSLSIDQVTAVGGFVLCVFSGYAFYLWIRSFADIKISTYCAIVYAIAPYHFYIDLYCRGAYAEFAAFLWIPLLFLGAKRMLQKPNVVAFFLFSISVAGILSTHLLTTLLVAPFLILYGLYLVTEDSVLKISKKFRHLASLASAGGVGILGAAYYLLPIYQLMPYTNSTALVFNVADHLALSFLHLEGGTLKFMARISALEFIYLSATIILSVTVYKKYRMNKTSLQPTIIWLAFTFFCFFLMSGIFTSIWYKPSPFAWVQFPWRLLSLVEFFFITAAAVHLSLRSAKNGDNPNHTIIRFVFSGIIAISVLGCIYDGRKLFYNPPASSADFVKKRIGPPEYWPTNVQPEEAYTAPKTYEQYFSNSSYGRIVGGSGTASISNIKHGIYKVITSSSKPLRVEIDQFFFPGWVGHDLTTDRDIQLFAGDGMKFVQFNVPSGEHIIEVTRLRLPIEQTANFISAIAVTILLISGVISLWLSQKDVRRLG